MLNYAVVINGFTFTLTSFKGILIKSDTAPDMENPEARKALRMLLELLPDFDDFVYAIESDSYYVPRERTVSNEAAELRPGLLKLFIQDNKIQVDGNRAWRAERQANNLPKGKDKNGYVYLLKTDKGFWKIGRSKTPDGRKKTFGVTLPFDVEFECLIKTSDMWLLESKLHAQYASKRIDGEWFKLDTDDVEYIKSLAGAS